MNAFRQGFLAMLPVWSVASGLERFTLAGRGRLARRPLRWQQALEALPVATLTAQVVVSLMARPAEVH